MFEGFQTRQIDTGEAIIHVRVGGKGRPLLLLHGYPETGAMWHKVASALAEHFTCVVPDLRGYGDSSKPPSDKEHYVYCKRANGNDQVKVMQALGFEKFMVAGHDRGGRVTHRMCLDHPDRIERASILDIMPTPVVYGTVNQRVGTAYYHWFFLIQPTPYPETMIGHDPEFYLRHTLTALSTPGTFSEEIIQEYLRTFRMPETIHATCEDYRAGATIDLKHHKEDNGRKIACPLQILWGEKGLVGRAYETMKVWADYAENAIGQEMPSGHFIPEQAPQETVKALLGFFKN
ncbi:MAG: alpha/beta fold hydrolase [Reyranellaceae bacterium]